MSTINTIAAICKGRGMGKNGGTYRKDITNRTYGTFKVIKFSHMVGHDSFWECSCSLDLGGCGKETLQRARILPYLSSCGCLRNKKINEKYNTIKSLPIEKIVEYNPDLGTFRWTDNSSRPWCKDMPIGSIDGGYLRICVNGKRYQAHRLAWLLMTGHLPKCKIDHINLNKLDNRWCNLREANNFESARNKAPCHHNRSGYKGVYSVKERWRASIKYNCRSINLGCFTTKEEAALAYNKKAIELFGEFAYLNEVK